MIFLVALSWSLLRCLNEAFRGRNREIMNVDEADEADEAGLLLCIFICLTILTVITLIDPNPKVFQTIIMYVPKSNGSLQKHKMLTSPTSKSLKLRRISEQRYHKPPLFPYLVFATPNQTSWYEHTVNWTAKRRTKPHGWQQGELSPELLE